MNIIDRIMLNRAYVRELKARCLDLETAAREAHDELRTFTEKPHSWPEEMTDIYRECGTAAYAVLSAALKKPRVPIRGRE